MKVPKGYHILSMIRIAHFGQKSNARRNIQKHNSTTRGARPRFSLNVPKNKKKCSQIQETFETNIVGNE